jgi:DNA modification methylase/predicted RNA-binding Zn-ribbon protein involved in translation (DUF1610 family)
MTRITGQEQQGTLALQQTQKKAGPVQCLGLTFENDEARREHFLALLNEKLQDPEFRKIPGFPQGSDEAILRMSDPPYYTACPNPFLEDFVRCYGKPYDPKEVYKREPFAVDVSEGKNSPVYKAISYYTKVPYEAIMPSLLHYTAPGDIVLDGFCGSGMTGVAAQMCGTAPPDLRSRINQEFSEQGLEPPEWGARGCVLSDLSPLGSLISATYNLPFDKTSLVQLAAQILDDVNSSLGWMYETMHTDGKSVGRINYMVWSEVFACPSCGAEIVFTDAALDLKSQEVKDVFSCPSCDASLTKRRLDRIFETFLDPVTGKPSRRIKMKPVLVNYTLSRGKLDKEVDEYDLEVLRRIENQEMPSNIPICEFPIEAMYHGSRLQPKGFTHVHSLYTKRALLWMSSVWKKISEIADPRTARALMQLLLQQVVNGSLRNSYRPGSTFGNRAITGVYYVSSMAAEANMHLLANGSIRRLSRMAVKEWLEFDKSRTVSISTQSSTSLATLADSSIDYIFTDPPFGENIFYSDLSIPYDAWIGIRSSPGCEAIKDEAKNKGISDYQELMRRCFTEYNRVIKPGRWITIVFSNSSNRIWRAIQEALGAAGFVVADVRTLDKKQGSYRQVTSTAVKQDLVISAYKPDEEVLRFFELESSGEESAWVFVREHLRNIPLIVGRNNEIEIVAERTSQMLLDRMIAFHVQHGLSVPLSGPEFLQGLTQRFPERDGMYFLPDQVTEYDRKRTTATQLRQLSFFVNDEHSAIQWIRQQLQDKPQSFQDLQPQFMRELQAWAKHEQTVELKVILEQNFLHYDGRSPVPSQIHSYLSSNFKDLRNLAKEDPKLIEKAQDRWYVPDPNKQSDLDRVRDRALLKEFEEIKESSQRRIKQFRTEAVRAGFKACWQERDYATIVKVAAKLPEAVLQEDEKLLMYIDNAQTRLGDDA